jgi:parallel beta-helix repeat protein
MTYTFKLSRRLAVSWSQYWGMLVPLLLLSAACTDNELLSNTDGDAGGWNQAGQVELSPSWVFAEVNQPIQLLARERLSTRVAGDIEVEWTVSGGTITQDGLFSAARPGEYKVVGKGRGGKKGDTTTVVVGDSVSNVVALVLTPDTATLQPAQTRHFAAEGVLSDGTAAPVGTVWTADGGIIDAGGNYVAGSSAGRYHVIATSVSGTLADTATVDVSLAAPTLVAVELTPSTTSLVIGGTKQFVAQGRLSDGGTTAANAQFTASGGTITSAGLFTAGATPGTYRVIAKTSEGLADTSAVTLTGTASGTVIYPGTDIQAVVDANPSGTSFLLKAGVHRMQQVDPKNGNVFTGESGTVLSGARELTTFARSGAYWVVGGQTQRGRATDVKHCEVGYEGCQWPEDLFIDDRLLLRVTSLAQVGPGKWYLDYTTDKIYLGDDPSGRRVETSVSAYAFGGRASNVTLRNLVIEKYASPAQAGAIHGDETTDWRVEDCEVRQSHGIGIRIGDRWQVRGCRVHANGQLGLARGGTGSIIEGCDIYGNKTVPFKTGFAGGALKFSKSKGLVFQNNRVHGNLGNGVWLDIDNIDYQVRDNIVYDNASQGIFVEISYRGKVYNNKVYGNGFGRNSSWLYGAGILIAASPDVEVYGNEVTNNANGIAAIQQNRGSGAYGPHEISNLYVHDNVVTMTEGKTGLAQSVGDNSYFTSRNNRWARNTYTLGRNANYFAWVGGAISEAEWRQAGQDLEGTFRR